MIPYGRQEISKSDVESVISVLQSEYLTQGPVVEKFENYIADFCNSKYSVAVNSATSALHIAVASLELGHDDILWTSPITFVASANCARYCGASVDFIDIDPDTFNICPDALNEKLEHAQRAGRLPSVIVVVHMGGQSADMERISCVVRPYGIRIVEDASHAIGGYYHGRPVGNCEFSDITVFSFHPVKIITTAEGGMALTNSEELASKMKLLRSHGITRDQSIMTRTASGSWYYEQLELGWNYRMSDIHAALGLSQANRISNFVERRNRLASVYDELLDELPVDIPGRQKNTVSSFHLYIIRLKDELSVRQREIFGFLSSKGIGVNIHYIPVHLQPYYRALGFREGDYPIAEDYYSRALTIPLFPNLSSEQQLEVVHALKTVINQSSSMDSLAA